MAHMEKLADSIKAFATNGKLTIQNEDGEDYKILSTELLINEMRLAVYRQKAELKDVEAIAVIHCEDSNGKCDHVGAVTVDSNGEATEITPVIATCEVMYDDIPLTGLIEYMFADDGVWRLGVVSLSTLVTVRQGRYKVIVSQKVFRLNSKVAADRQAPNQEANKRESRLAREWLLGAVLCKPFSFYF